MNVRTLAFLLIASATVSGCAKAPNRVALDQPVPFLDQRLHSSRSEVRYGLLSELIGKDGKTRRALETLTRDEDEAVANQALVRYTLGFVSVDKRLFDPRIYLRDQFPVADLPETEPNKALVDYCLGRRKITPRSGRIDDFPPALAVLDPQKKDEPAMEQSLTIVGILGQPEDAPLLHPFLESANDYVVLGAAKALLRLGDRRPALEALARMTEKDPRTDLHYITEALCVLKEVEQPEYKEMIVRVLARVDKTQGIQPNWLNRFLFLAAEVKDDVWK